MAKVGDVFPSKFLKPEDLQGQACTLTTKLCKIEDSFGEQKPVCYFYETEKAFTVNSSNARIITQLLEDDETDHWVNVKLTLTPTMRKIAGTLKKVIDVTDARFDRTGQQAAAAPFPPAVPPFGAAPQGGRQVDENDPPF